MYLYTLIVRKVIAPRCWGYFGGVSALHAYLGVALQQKEVFWGVGVGCRG